jgi:hypothetical protein
MNQTSFIPPGTKEHGGSLSLAKRRGPRPLSTKESLHLTLRSDFAKGQRSLLLHQDLIQKIIEKVEKLFQVRVYNYAICHNHIHVLLRGKNRVQLRNCFRVLAGHIAQQILLKNPYTKTEMETVRASQPKGHPKNKRKLWALLTYTRIVGWGKEFRSVVNYILQNTLEALNKIAYKPRNKNRSSQPRQKASPFSTA